MHACNSCGTPRKAGPLSRCSCVRRRLHACGAAGAAVFGTALEAGRRRPGPRRETLPGRADHSCFAGLFARLKARAATVALHPVRGPLAPGPLAQAVPVPAPVATASHGDGRGECQRADGPASLPRADNAWTHMCVLPARPKRPSSVLAMVLFALGIQVLWLFRRYCDSARRQLPAVVLTCGRRSGAAVQHQRCGTATSLLLDPR